MPRPDHQYLPARAKLWIASIDDPDLELRAQYNPKELQIDKQIPWGDHKDGDNRSGAKRAEASKQSDLEFTGAAKRTMQLELLFDGYEEGDSVQPDVERLEQMSTVRNPEEPDEDLRRPHHCLVAWGSQQSGLRPFRCVIESLSTKYTMWDTNGTPLRATCTVKLKEAEKMSRTPRTPPYEVKERPPQWDRAAGRPR
jgi:hypothetical protein